MSNDLTTKVAQKPHARKSHRCNHCEGDDGHNRRTCPHRHLPEAEAMMLTPQGRRMVDGWTRIYASDFARLLAKLPKPLWPEMMQRAQESAAENQRTSTPTVSEATTERLRQDPALAHLSHYGDAYDKRVLH